MKKNLFFLKHQIMLLFLMLIVGSSYGQNCDFTSLNLGPDLELCISNFENGEVYTVSPETDLNIADCPYEFLFMTSNSNTTVVQNGFDLNLTFDTNVSPPFSTEISVTLISGLPPYVTDAITVTVYPPVTEEITILGNDAEVHCSEVQLTGLPGNGVWSMEVTPLMLAYTDYSQEIGSNVGVFTIDEFFKLNLNGTYDSNNALENLNGMCDPITATYTIFSGINGGGCVSSASTSFTLKNTREAKILSSTDFSSCSTTYRAKGSSPGCGGVGQWTLTDSQNNETEMSGVNASFSGLIPGIYNIEYCVTASTDVCPSSCDGTTYEVLENDLDTHINNIQVVTCGPEMSNVPIDITIGEDNYIEFHAGNSLEYGSFLPPLPDNPIYAPFPSNIEFVWNTSFEDLPAEVRFSFTAKSPNGCSYTSGYIFKKAPNPDIISNNNQIFCLDEVFHLNDLFTIDDTVEKLDLVFNETGSTGEYEGDQYFDAESPFFEAISTTTGHFCFDVYVNGYTGPYQDSPDSDNDRPYPCPGVDYPFEVCFDIVDGLEANISSSNDSYCVGESYNFGVLFFDVSNTASALDPNAHPSSSLWTVDPATASITPNNEVNTSIVFNESGAYEVTYTANQGEECGATDAVTVFVEDCTPCDLDEYSILIDGDPCSATFACIVNADGTPISIANPDVQIFWSNGETGECSSLPGQSITLTAHMILYNGGKFIPENIICERDLSISVDCTDDPCPNVNLTLVCHEGYACIEDLNGNMPGQADTDVEWISPLQSNFPNPGTQECFSLIGLPVDVDENFVFEAIVTWQLNDGTECSAMLSSILPCLVDDPCEPFDLSFCIREGQEIICISDSETGVPLSELCENAVVEWTSPSENDLTGVGIYGIDNQCITLYSFLQLGYDIGSPVQFTVTCGDCVQEYSLNIEACPSYGDPCEQTCGDNLFHIEFPDDYPSVLCGGTFCIVDANNNPISSDYQVSWYNTNQYSSIGEGGCITPSESGQHYAYVNRGNCCEFIGPFTINCDPIDPVDPCDKQYEVLIPEDPCSPYCIVDENGNTLDSSNPDLLLIWWLNGEPFSSDPCFEPTVGGEYTITISLLGDPLCPDCPICSWDLGSVIIDCRGGHGGGHGGLEGGIKSSEVSSFSRDIFSFYPNPISGDVLFINREGKTLDDQMVTYQIVDATGKLVLSGTFAQQSMNQIKVTSMEAGLYFIFLRDEVGNILSQSSFVKE